jgi:hypothetical protein
MKNTPDSNAALYKALLNPNINVTEAEKILEITALTPCSNETAAGNKDMPLALIEARRKKCMTHQP